MDLYGGKRGGKFGAAAGAGLGAIIGGGLGAFGSGNYAYNVAKQNQQIIGESPFYNSSMLTAERLNASGDIVLGAHNTRRGGY